MKKLLIFVVLVALVAVAYSILSDPLKRERVLGTLEDSTGVDLGQTVEDAGRQIGQAAGNALKELGDYLTDPEFRRSLERFGRDALDKINELTEDQRQDLMDDLEQEWNREDRDFDEILERYLGRSGDS